MARTYLDGTVTAREKKIKKTETLWWVPVSRDPEIFYLFIINRIRPRYVPEKGARPVLANKETGLPLYLSDCVFYQYTLPCQERLEC